MNRRIERQINSIYQEVYKKVFTKPRLSSLMKGNKRDIRRAVLRLQASEDYKRFAKKFAKKLAIIGLSNQRGVWRKYFNAAKASHNVVLPESYSKFELQVMEKAIQHNFEMITSIPKEVLELTKFEYTNTLIEQVAKNNLGRLSFERQLKQHGAVRARLIARTETAKLQTVITQNRATELGSAAYIWRSSKDKRTRPSHRAMNDVIVFWRLNENRPLLDNMYGNAGEFPNCRCTPLPIFDEDDLTKSSYNVYDYRKHKIVNMKRIEVIRALQKGRLD